MQPIHRFNIRVYGLWINDDRQVLLSDELVQGQPITKFPGGGLEYGEGPADCLKREWQEELHTEIEITGQYYFTDYFVPSFMNDGSQVISIYFLVKPKATLSIPVRHNPKKLHQKQEGSENFRLAPIAQLTPGDLSLPIDKKVMELIKQDF